MTPYQKRMAESKARKSQILKLAKAMKPDGSPKYSQAEIAKRVDCSRAYVNQIIGGNS